MSRRRDRCGHQCPCRRSAPCWRAVQLLHRPVLKLKGRHLAQQVHGETAGFAPRTRARLSTISSSSRSVVLSRNRFAMTAQEVGEISMPIHCRFKFCDASNAVPQPQNASSTMSFSFATRFDNSFKQGKRLLRWITETFCGLRLELAECPSQT